MRRLVTQVLARKHWKPLQGCWTFESRHADLFVREVKHLRSTLPIEALP